MDTLAYYDRESLDMEVFVEMPKNLAKARPSALSSLVPFLTLALLFS